MTRALVAGALVAAAAFSAAPASAFGCPPGTAPTTLPTGRTVCAPASQCALKACPIVACPTDIPVWSSTCRQVFGG